MKKQNLESWMTDNRYNSESLSREFQKRGVDITGAAIRAWKNEGCRPIKKQTIKVLSEITGINAELFFL